MAKKLGAVLTSVGLVVAGGIGGFVLDKDPQPTPVDLSKFVTKTDLANATDGLATADQVTSLQDEILAEDRWEAIAKVLALEEVEDDDYEELREHLGLTEDFEDLDFTVEVKDVDYDNVDVDEENADVKLELKVRYEDADGHNVRKTVYADVVVEDGEVEEVEYS